MRGGREAGRLFQREESINWALRRLGIAEKQDTNRRFLCRVARSLQRIQPIWVPNMGTIHGRILSNVWLGVDYSNCIVNKRRVKLRLPGTDNIKVTEYQCKEVCLL